MGKVIELSISFAMFGFGLLMFVWAYKLFKDEK